MATRRTGLSPWKARAYPVPATKAAGDDLTATRHALRKWRGLRA